jgi:hypothetical protein
VVLEAVQEGLAMCGEIAGGPGARGEVEAGAPPPPTESPQAQADKKRRELEAAEEAR